MLIYIHKIVNDYIDMPTFTSENILYSNSNVYYSIKVGGKLLDSSQNMDIEDSDTMQIIKDKIFKYYVDMVKEVE